MFVVRPAEIADIAALEALAAVDMPGVHTLPKTREKIGTAVERSIASFAAQVDIPSEESYLFVLESLASLESRALAGTAAISASAGSNGTYFSFRNDVIQQVSRDLNISHSVHALTLCSELSAYSQLSGFYMRNLAEAGREAALLSRARLLFARLAPQRFGERFFVPLAGITNAAGQSPFWDALGRKFFQMDFLDAEKIIGGARNRTLIVELMPHYPVYVPLLPGAAQAAMGQIHPGGELAFNLLTEEGFEADDYIDIFDGGPILQAHKHSLRSFAGAMLRQVAALNLATPAATPAATPSAAPSATPSATPGATPAGALFGYVIASCAEHNFRAVICDCAALEATHRVSLPPQVRQALQVAPGDSVICVRI